MITNQNCQSETLVSRSKLLFYMVRGGPNNTRIVKLMTGKDRKPSGKENLALECDDMDGIKTLPQFPASPCSKSDKVCSSMSKFLLFEHFTDTFLLGF